MPIAMPVPVYQFKLRRSGMNRLLALPDSQSRVNPGEQCKRLTTVAFDREVSYAW